MHKKGVPGAGRIALNATGEQRNTGRDFIAKTASVCTFGKHAITAWHAVVTGLSSGSLRVVLSD
jgi:hypothetical protein